MIERLSNISKKMLWVKPAFVLIGVASLGLFIFSVLSANSFEHNVYLIPSILGFVWSLLYLMIATAFPQVPIKPDKNVKFFKRLKIRFIRGIYHLLAIIFIVASLAVILMSFRMLGIWSADF